MKNKLIIPILVLLISLIAISKIDFSHADSGFDTSYDSGGYSSSSYDYSSFDYGTDYNYYSSSSSNKDNYTSTKTRRAINPNEYTKIQIIIFLATYFFIYISNKKNITIITSSIIIMVMTTIPLIINKNEFSIISIILISLLSLLYSYKPQGSNPNLLSRIGNINEIPPEQLYEEGQIEIPIIKQELFEQFVNIQTSWMNIDYKSLEKSCIDTLYNTYVTQLKSLKSKKQKNIISNIKYIDSKIKQYNNDKNLEKIIIIMEVEMKDYITNNYDMVLRGNSDTPLDIIYEMVFVRNKNNNHSCPNCGAEVTGTKCEYCDSIVPTVKNNWQLASKKVLSQK